MIRFIGVVLFLFLFLILGIPVLGIEWLVSKVSKRTADYQSLHIVQWAFRVILVIAGVEVTVIGEENVPDEPVRPLLLPLYIKAAAEGPTGLQDPEHLPVSSLFIRERVKAVQ